jgi:hypothetical protein
MWRWPAAATAVLAGSVFYALAVDPADRALPPIIDGRHC